MICNRCGREHTKKRGLCDECMKLPLEDRSNVLGWHKENKLISPIRKIPMPKPENELRYGEVNLFVFKK